MQNEKSFGAAQCFFLSTVSVLMTQSVFSTSVFTHTVTLTSCKPTLTHPLSPQHRPCRHFYSMRMEEGVNKSKSTAGICLIQLTRSRMQPRSRHIEGQWKKKKGNTILSLSSRMKGKWEQFSHVFLISFFHLVPHKSH